MRLKLDETFLVTSDDRQFILNKKVNGRYIPVAYFTEIENLLQYHLNHKIRLSDVKTINSLLNELKSLKSARIEAEHRFYSEIEPNNQKEQWRYM